MDREQMKETSLEDIRHLLSHLHGEVTALEESYTQLLQVLRKIEGAANVDDLTGLLRRRAFFDQWNTLLDECQRLNEENGVLMIDIDHFKRINDTHGHATGDEVIKGVATLLKQFESPNCIVGRIGGEEFAVAIRGSTAEISGIAEFIRRGAERLHGPVIQPHSTGDIEASRDANSDREPTEWKCTLSVGMVCNNGPGSSNSTSNAPDAPRLLQAADIALYQAKSAGRNRVCAA
jgi:diguanylate cyclase (GGDEF)-like protein